MTMAAVTWGFVSGYICAVISGRIVSGRWPWQR